MKAGDNKASISSKLDDIWPGWRLTVVGERPSGGEKLRGYNRRQKRRRNELEALGIIQDIDPFLITGLGGVFMSEGYVERMLEAVCKDCDGYNLRRRHNFVISGLAQGVKEGLWEAYLPAPMGVLHREAAPFTPDKFAVLPALRELRRKFDLTLANSEFFEDASTYIDRVRVRADSPSVTAEQLQAGQIIFSAAVNGGLLHRKWLAQLGSAITTSLIVEDDLVWLNLEDTEGEGEREQHYMRRWFPDPLTALLILRWYKQHGHHWPGDINDLGALKQTNFLLGRFIAAIELDAVARPSQAQLLDAASTRLGLQLPPFVLRYAKSRFQAPSLTPIQWARLRRQRSIKYRDVKQVLPTAVSMPKTGRPLAERYYKGSVGFQEQQEKIKAILDVLSRYHYKKSPKVGPITKEINRILTVERKQLSPVVASLAKWSLAYMQGTQPNRGKIKPSSMHNYLSAIGKHIVTHGIEINIMEASSQDWISLYDSVLNEAPSLNNKKYKADRLVDFHAFLVQTHNIPIVEVEDIAGIATCVDVNIVSSREYVACRAYLLSDKKYSPRLCTIQSLLLTLGYRCGLRRDEGLTLEVRDIQGRVSTGNKVGEKYGRYELLVQNNVYGDVKSQKSVRRIPLRTLLAEEELRDLIEWKNKRLREISGDTIHQQLLFCHTGEDTAPLFAKETFDPLTSALRLATGDPAIRYHHLRHSFTNIELLRLIEDECPRILPKEWIEVGGKSILPASDKSARQLLRLCPESKPSRRLMYAVSLLCGHIDPKETIDTYVHLLDWILGNFLKNNKVELSTVVQANLLGISESSLKVYRSRKRLRGVTTAADLLTSEASRYQNKLKDPAIAKTVSTSTYNFPESLASEGVQRPSPYLLYSMFRLHFQHQSAESIAERYGYGTQDVHSWINSAKRLAALKTNTKKKKSKLVRSSHKCLTVKQLALSPHLPGLCPASPHADFEKKDIDRVFTGLLALFEQDEMFARKGLRIYFRKATSTRTDLKLTGDANLAEWCRFLNAIGIPLRRIRATVILHPLHREKAIRRHWARLLNLPVDNIVPKITRQSVTTPRSEFGSITIWVESSSNKKDKQRLVNNNSNWSAQGLRFALFMGSVVLLGENE